MENEDIDEVTAESGVLDGIEEDEATSEAIQKAKDSLEYFSPREFDGDFLHVYMNDPFLGQISMEITKRIDLTVPTAYIGLRRDARQNYEIIMGYNPKFMRSLGKAERVGVIRHELYHLIFQHILGRGVSDPDNQKLYNWATDLAINSIIGYENLPKMCLFPGKRPIDPATGKPVEGVYADFLENAKPNESSD